MIAAVIDSDVENEVENDTEREAVENTEMAESTLESIDTALLQTNLSIAGVAISDETLGKLTSDQVTSLWAWSESKVPNEPQPEFLEWDLEGSELFLKTVEADFPDPAIGSTGETATATPDAAPSPATSAEPESKLGKHMKLIFEASAHANRLRDLLDDAASETKAAKAHEKECLENLHAAEKELSRVIDDAKTGQQKLPFDDGVATSDSTSGPSAAKTEIAVEQDWPISELGAKPIKKTVGKEEFQKAKDQDDGLGLSDSQLDKFAEHDISTIRGLEKWMNENPFWHQSIKGFGDAAIQRVISTLVAFRSKNPIE